MKYFGTDGIRGIPNKKLTIELATKLGMALKCLESDDIVIATDTRISKDMLAYAIASGAMSRGMNVYFAGVMPTPALIYTSEKMNIVGVMITASHNPYTDNGIKVLNRGIKLSEEEESKVETLIDEPNEYEGKIGRLVNLEGARKDYIDFLLKKAITSKLKICIDCANGATSTTAPIVFSKITENLVATANKPDGVNINNGVGSTHLEFLKENVLKNKCDIGFAFDGDGDRVLCVDKNGKTIDGDMLIFILAKYLKQKNMLNENKVVLTIMSNLGLISNLKSNGIDVVETPVGDKYVVRELMENKLSVGGENSGHIIMPDELKTGDGVLVALTIVKLLEETKTDISSWLNDVEMYADKLVNVRVKDRNKVINNKKIFDRIAEIKYELNNDCKIIVRASGTEDLIRVTVMAKTKELVNKYSNELTKMVEEC